MAKYCNFYALVIQKYRRILKTNNVRYITVRQTRWLPSDPANAERPVIYEMIVRPD